MGIKYMKFNVAFINEARLHHCVVVRELPCVYVIFLIHGWTNRLDNV